MINAIRPKFSEGLLDSFTIRTLSSAIHLMDCFFAAQERRRLNKPQRRLIMEYVEHISQVLSYTTRSNEWVTIGLQWCKIPWSALRNAKLVNIMRTSSTSHRNLYTQLQLLGLLMHGGLDAIGPLPKSSGGHLYILAATDYFSKWAEAVPLREVKKETVVNFIQTHLICQYGVPQYIITDNGKPFYNRRMIELCEKFEFKQYNSSMYNGPEIGRAHV